MGGASTLFRWRWRPLCDYCVLLLCSMWTPSTQKGGASTVPVLCSGSVVAVVAVPISGTARAYASLREPNSRQRAS